VFLLAGVPLFCFSQDYQTVRSDFVHFFLDENGNDHGMRMDSVGVEGNDSVLINYLTLRYKTYGVFEAYAPSWLGAKTIIKPNGDNLFFNEGLDTILIKSQAQLLDTWSLFTLDSTSYLEGRIVGIGTNEVLDSLVEIKVIEIQGKNFSGIAINHPLNGKTMAISKTLGILLGFDFHLFPEDTAQVEIAGMENPDVGIHRLTKGEAYDFQVGDEFHYSRTEGSPSNVNYWEQRIHRVNNVSGNTYQIYVGFDIYKRTRWFNGPIGPETEVVQSTFITANENWQDLGSRMAFMPRQASVFDTTQVMGYGILDIANIGMHSSGRLAAHHNSSTAMYEQDSLGFWSEAATVSGGESTTNHYAAGIGKTKWRYFYSDGWEWDEQTESLRYFTPFTVSWIMAIENRQISNPSVYPNPIREGDLLTVGEGCKQLELFDLNGKLLLIRQNPTNLQTEGLKPGVYILRVSGENGTTSRQRLVVTD